MERAVSLIWIKRCVSTQDELWAASPEVTAIATAEQSAGRGRRGRVWQSEPGQSLALSWRAPIFGIELYNLPLLSLAAGLAVYRWVSGLAAPEQAEHLALKWPNDLLFMGRKLAGVLCEGRLVTVHHETQQQVVIGIGVNLLSAPPLIPSPAYLRELSVDDLSLASARARLGDLIVELERGVSLLRTQPDKLIEFWRAASLPIGTPLSAGIKRGVYAGINERGALLLDIDGGLCTVDTGEVHVLSYLP